MKVSGPTYFGIACLAASTFVPLTAMAQAEDIRRELGRCAAITEVNARVACYDNLAHAPQIKPLARQPSLPTTTPEPAAVKPENAGQSQAGHVPERNDNQALLDKVTSLKELQTNKVQITLASGQVWQQTVSKAFLLRVDDSVRIVGTGWGQSFRLSTEGHPDFIQVRRLR